jgi:ABC-2 type transport system permease protein
MAANWVRRGTVSAAVILKSKTDESTTSPSATALVDAEILADSYDQVASQILGAVVQKALLSSRQELAGQAVKQLRQPPIASPAVFESSPQDLQPVVRTSVIAESQSSSFEVPKVLIRDVLGENKSNPVIAMYAAGIAVMFSLFSTTTASGSLLEERENSTLERLLCSKLSIDQLLMGKWLYLSVLGFVQVTLMFIWGWLVFGVDLPNHLSGFFLMTLATSTSVASFALMIATCCKSRGQLGWLSTIIILVMSALGGSMVPRYLMSESVQQVGMFTFNAWALEGYNKVFWREQSIQTLTLELGVLVASAFAMLVVARGLISRWERV